MARAGGIDMRPFKLLLVSEIRKAVLGGAAGAVSEAAATAAALSAQIGNRSDIAHTHEFLAASMREAIRTRYQTNVEQRKTHIDYGPRQGSPSRLQGVLWDALKDEQMCTGDARGIALGNDRLLLGAAKHLYRLQFGTRGEGGEDSPPAREYPITLFGDRLFDVGLLEDPRPAFSMPPGLFLGSSGRTGGAGYSWYAPDQARRGDDIYFPSRSANRIDPIKTRAIQARRFLDAGLEDLSEKFPGAYNRLVDGWLNRDTRAGQIFVHVRDGKPSNLGKVK